jgi:hypothetical protein
MMGSAGAWKVGGDCLAYEKAAREESRADRESVKDA